MKNTYDRYILKLNDVNWAADRAELLNIIESREGDGVMLRLRQKGCAQQIVNIDDVDPEVAIANTELDLEQVFNAEIITQRPRCSPYDSKVVSNYVDHNDFKAFRSNTWSSRNGGKPNPIRPVPMFFRDNGMVVDLVDHYRGRTAFLILNGSSFNAIDHSLLKQPGIVTFCVNNGGHGFRPNLWTCVDDPARFMPSIWEDPTIMKFVPMAHFARRILDKETGERGLHVAAYPNVLGYRRSEKFIASRWLYEDTVNWGNHRDRGDCRSVMLVALRILFLLGFRRVNLLGCDFRMSEQNKYWFTEERTEKHIKENNWAFGVLQGYFKELLPYFAEEGFEVYNCNPESALQVFPHVSFADALASAQVDTSGDTGGMYVSRPKDGP